MLLYLRIIIFFYNCQRIADIRATLIYIIFLSSIFSQTKNLNFEKYTEIDGLSGSLCAACIQDSFGFLWIGTDKGLNRFNGHDFQTFIYDANDSTSLTDNVVRTVIQTKDSSIWVGTKNGLNKFSYSQKQIKLNNKISFQHFFYDASNDNSLSNNSINAIYQDSSGKLWIGTHNGLNMLDLDKYSENYNPTFMHYFNNPKDSNSISHKAIKTIVGDNEGNLWIGTLGGGLNKFNIKTGKFKRYFDEDKSRTGKYILSLFFDHNGILWIGTYGNGLIKFDINTEQFTIYKNKPNNIFSISDNRVVTIQEDKNNTLWVGTLGGGINKFDPEKEHFVSYKNNSLNNKYLISNLVYSMLVDNSNNLWIGTNKGLNKVDLKPVKFKLFRNDPMNKNSILDNYVLSIIEDHSGNLWIGNNKGVDRIDRITKKYTHYKFYQKRSKNKYLQVFKIIEDSKQNIWAGTFGNDLYKLNKQKNEFEKFQFEKDSNKTTGIRIVELLEDRSGNLLIGAYPGLYIFNTKKSNLTNFPLCNNDSININKKNINVLYEDERNNLWIGTTSGLFSFSYITKRCKSYVSKFNMPNSVASSFIQAILENKAGIMWIGTGNGLYSYNRKTEKFRHFTKENGLPGNYISNILEDNEGNLWISSNKWISKFNGQDFKNYSEEDGLQGLGFNTQASFKNKKGKMYFGGINGFNQFFPAQVKNNPYKPEVVLTTFKIFNKVVKSGLKLAILDKIILQYSESFFSFEFSALDYTNPSQNQYAYKLDGFDTDWNYIGNRRFASYTNLDAGKYKFKIKASNNDGIWSDKIKSILIIIQPPLWQTWWAYLFYTLVFVGGIISLRNYELNKRRKKEKERLRVVNAKAKLKQSELRAETAEYKAKVSESQKEIEIQKIRNRISADLHDEIGSNLSSIILLSSLVKKNKKNDDEIKKYTSDIYNAAKVSSEAIRDIVWFINPISDQLGKLVSKMLQTANTLLGDIEHQINTSKFDTTEKLRPDVKRNIFLIYKESLTNIIKHSKADFVKINVKEENNTFKFTISDNGIGFDIEKVKNGNGLRNLKYRAEQIKAKLLIYSEIGKGTVVSFEYNIA